LSPTELAINFEKSASTLLVGRQEEHPLSWHQQG